MEGENLSDVLITNEDLDALTSEQHMLLVYRAAKSLGIWVDWDDGILLIDEDADYESDEFQEAWEHEAKKMVITQWIAELEGDGDVVPSVDTETGQLMYEAVDHA
jgi:hypothetical protein